MQRVVGRRLVETTDAEVAALRARYPKLLLDVGTGDGKHAYLHARRHPDTLVVGLDASRDGMREVSAKAAARPAKGGLENLLFVWAAAERPPPELRGVTAMHVVMPWGSLLRGVLHEDGALRTALGATCAPGAEFLLVVNLHAWRPPVPEVAGIEEPTPDAAHGTVGAWLARDGWAVGEARYLGAEEVATLTSSWGRRLRSSRSEFDVLLVRGTVG